MNASKSPVWSATRVSRPDRRVRSALGRSPKAWPPSMVNSGETNLESKDAESGGTAVTTALDMAGARASAPPPEQPNAPKGQRSAMRRRLRHRRRAGLGSGDHRGGARPRRARHAPRAAVPSATPSASDGPLSVSEIYQTLLPSVVLIQTTGGTRSGTGQGFGDRHRGDRQRQRDHPHRGARGRGRRRDQDLLRRRDRVDGRGRGRGRQAGHRHPDPGEAARRRWCRRCSVAASRSATTWWRSATRSG